MISVDPGVGGTGVVEWNANRIERFDTLHAKEGEWLLKAKSVADAFESFLSNTKFRVGQVALEGPVFLPGAGGHTVAASGDLCKLALLTGMLLRVSFKHTTNVRLISPLEWKGQLSKDAAERRIRRILGSQFPEGRISNHAIDAIGIGLFVQDLF